ncbi:dihydrofolate reductase family protein [Tateyamaria sp. SN3-11]|uniref:dihydrofolate reductase family protein n=1 Tax=Tateyamaria sp. SN3-11 TaxID=3092147 RepID=UPI0039EA798B
MRDLAVISFVSLDGVAQGPVAPDEDTSGGFAQSGWASAHLEEAMELVNAELMETPVSFLFGRKTFEMFAGHWPNSTTAHGMLLNTAQKYVVTTTLDDPGWQNARIITGDVIAELRRIKATDGPRIQAHGSIALIQTLIAQDLVDEFRLLTFPVVLGSGKRLFGAETGPRHLTCVRSGSSPGGVTMGVYRRH